uniref:RNA-directed DNA polymerase, eukaryota n=1 Tax=Tanacetum cinerariifolium TaxID=118510 RepID=A0A6L2P065_TANCI|nr:RNA-directed DNA polymerase, eukaryota [Tanacetum cinerariifolium]
MGVTSLPWRKEITRKIKFIDQEKLFTTSDSLRGRDDINDVDDLIISKDPFKIYDLLEKQKLKGNNVEDDIWNGTLNYPPGFTLVEEGDIKTVKVDILNGVEQGCTQNANEQVNNVEEKSNKGGILCVRDPRTFRKQNSTVLDYFVAIQGVWIPHAKKCLLIPVYAPQEVFEKRMLWFYLYHVIDNWSGETIIMGYFNEVPSKEERYGSIFNDHNASLFNSFISLGGLVEVLLGEGLIGMCLNISAITLDRYLSDHRPILLREVCHDYRPILFQLFHYWFEWKGFDDLVKDTWNKSSITNNNAISKFIKKLKLLKEQIRLFVRAKKESACMQRLNLKGTLTEIDLLIDKKKVDRVLLNKRSQVMNSLHDLGKYVVDGDSSKSQDKALNLDKIDDLERNLTKEEIKRVVWDYGKDKSPSPDGFTFGFYRRYWDIMERDVIDAVSYFFTEGMFPKGCNASFIALIPKMQDAKVVKDFRPISLIGSLYKIIAMILVNRLVMVLGYLVSEVQSAFIANRQILDGPFILNELIQWCKSKKKHTMIFKTDFEKAYNSVKWDYLDDVLDKVYALESDKKIMVDAKMNHNVLGFSFRQVPRNRLEMKQLTDLIAILEGVELLVMHDIWMWSLVGLGEFSVPLARKFIHDHRLIGGSPIPIGDGDGDGKRFPNRHGDGDRDEAHK